jgi:hypothetical protein
MTATLTRTKIISLAVLALGRTDKGGSVTVGSPLYESMEEIFHHTVLGELRKHIWSSSKKTSNLAINPDVIASPYRYAYDLPSDFVALVYIHPTTDLNPIYPNYAPVTYRSPDDYIARTQPKQNFSLVRRRVHTDKGSPLMLEYVCDVTQEIEIWDSLFSEVIVLALASKVARAYTGNRFLKGDLEKEYNTLIMEARRVNMLETASWARNNGHYVAQRNYLT